MWLGCLSYNNYYSWKGYDIQPCSDKSVRGIRWLQCIGYTTAVSIFWVTHATVSPTHVTHVVEWPIWWRVTSDPSYDNRGSTFWVNSFAEWHGSLLQSRQNLLNFFCITFFCCLCAYKVGHGQCPPGITTTSIHVVILFYYFCFHCGLRLGYESLRSSSGEDSQEKKTARTPLPV